MPSHLERSLLNSQRETSRVSLLTHVLDETIDDLENFRCGDPSLVVGEAI